MQNCEKFWEHAAATESSAVDVFSWRDSHLLKAPIIMTYENHDKLICNDDSVSATACHQWHQRLAASSEHDNRDLVIPEMIQRAQLAASRIISQRTQPIIAGSVAFPRGLQINLNRAGNKAWQGNSSFQTRGGGQQNSLPSCLTAELAFLRSPAGLKTGVSGMTFFLAWFAPS